MKNKKILFLGVVILIISNSIELVRFWDFLNDLQHKQPIVFWVFGFFISSIISFYVRNWLSIKNLIKFIFEEKNKLSISFYGYKDGTYKISEMRYRNLYDKTFKIQEEAYKICGKKNKKITELNNKIEYILNVFDILKSFISDYSHILYMQKNKINENFSDFEFETKNNKLLLEKDIIIQNLLEPTWKFKNIETQKEFETYLLESDIKIQKIRL